MLVPYQYRSCIVCLERPPGDPEHVIPRMLGGRLSARLLCNNCNHSFGSQFVSALKTDTSIRLAVDALKEKAPELAKQYLDGSEYVGRGSGGPEIRFRKVGNSLEFVPGKAADGSIVLDTDDALGALAKKLRRSGFDAGTIASYEALFSDAKEGEPVDIPTGETFVKRSASQIAPRFHPSTVKAELWLLIALEYSALVVGNEILRPSFDPIREQILGKRHTFEGEMKYLGAGSEYGPFHVLRLSPDYGTLAVEMRLFRWITTLVDISWIEYDGPHPAYLEDLGIRKSFLALDTQDVERNQWTELP